jgi:hypothetical protein
MNSPDILENTTELIKKQDMNKNQEDSNKQEESIKQEDSIKQDSMKHADLLDLTLPSIEFTYLFWSKIFTENELDLLKEKLNNNLENIITKLIPTYKISQKFNKYINSHYNDIKNRSQFDIQKSKSILAAILILFGILTDKFIITNQNYSQVHSGIVFLYLLFEFFPLQSDHIEETLNPILPLHHP